MVLDLINILTVTHTSAHVASKVFLRVALAGADPLVLIRISPANAKKEESRRAGSNRLPLLQLRVRFELLYRSRKVSYLQAKLSAQYRRVALNYVRVSLSW